MKNLFYSFVVILLLFSNRCFAQNDPISVFDQVWHSIDTLYSGFIEKDIDWNKLYKIYRPKINKGTSEKELFNIIAQMLRHLNDNHIQIAKENPERHFSAGQLGYLMDDISFDSVINMYMSLPVSKNYFTQGLNTLNVFSYGWLQDNIGYFHFREFKNLSTTQDAMETIIRYFSKSKAIIIDVRRNMGGEDEIGKLIADYFADKKRKYMICSYKNGTNHNDFTEERIWHIEPNQSLTYCKPVILLTDMTSFSEAEIFAMAMREIPHVKIVGNSTSGAYADSEWRTLPCGWKICIPYSLHTDKNGFCWEGIGIPPDYYIKTNPKNPIQEKDKLIEFAIELIND